MAVYHLCRICLTEDTNSDSMQPLFDDDNLRCSDIVRKLEECGGISLKAHDEFPKMICEHCLNSLDSSYRFRAMCQASEQALLDAIIKSELKMENQDNGSNIGGHSSKSNDENDIFFDLHTEIIDAEEVDLEVLTNDYDVESVRDMGETASNASSDSDYEYMRTRGKKNLKPTPKKTREPKPRGRPRLKKELTEENAKPKQRGRKKNPDEAPDQIMCEICGNIYDKRSKLNMHMRRHMDEKPFECDICAKTFACPSEIRRHMRVHTGEKPYACKFCGRTFADRSSNIKHERIHTKERPFACNTCGKAFTYSNVLKNHMLTHTGEKPFSCNPCNKTFSRKHQLDQHVATLTHQHTLKNLAAATAEITEDDLVIMHTQHNNSNTLVCIPTQ